MHNLFCDISICIKNYHSSTRFCTPKSIGIRNRWLALVYSKEIAYTYYIFSFWSFLAFLLAIKKNWLYNLMRIEEDARTRTTNVPSYAMYNLHSTTLFDNYFFLFHPRSEKVHQIRCLEQCWSEFFFISLEISHNNYFFAFIGVLRFALFFHLTVYVLKSHSNVKRFLKCSPGTWLESQWFLKKS